MNKRKKIYSVFSFLLAGTLCLSMAACGWNAHTGRGRNNIFCTVIRCTAREGFTTQTRG